MVAQTPRRFAPSTASNLIVIGGLNLVQGLPAYFFTIALPVLLRDAGATLDVVALTYIVWLPWAFKWLWAPLFDGRPSLRVWTLRLTPFALAIVFATLSVLYPSSAVAPVITVALISAILGATLQVVLAAEVVLRFDDKGRVLANTVQVFAMITGGVAGGSVVLWLGEAIGWQSAIWTTAGLIALLGSLGFLMTPSAAMVTERAHYWRAIVHRPTLALVVCAAIGGSAGGFLGARLVDLGHDPVEIGWYLGLAASLAMLPATLGAGALLRTLGLGNALRALFLLKALLLGSLGFAGLGPSQTVAFAIAYFALSAGLMTAMWQLYMTSVRPSAAATGFAFLHSLEALILMLAGFAIGAIAERIGFEAIFGVAAVAALIGAILSRPISPTASPTSNGEPSSSQSYQDQNSMIGGKR